VFERHPGLKLVITEVAGSGSWWPWTMAELDSAYLDNYHQVKDAVPNRPSEYCATNVYIGASFIADFEAEQAVRDGYADRILWGRDYPHAEGVWNYREDGVSTTRLHMRYAFANLPAAETKAMVSDNGIRCYGLDGAALAQVATRIGAPTLEELAVPLDAKPDGYSRGFRTVGPWA
jgi:predicted TIM-barrel fold metal-dependent hydrolase